MAVELVEEEEFDITDFDDDDADIDDDVRNEVEIDDDSDYDAFIDEDTDKSKPAVVKADEPGDRRLKRSIADRLTPKLAKESWTAIPNSLLENYRTFGLSADQAMFLIHVLSFKWDERKPFPGLKRVAATMGVDYSTVRRYAKKCRDLGLLKMERRSGRTCLYDFSFLFSQLEDIVAKKQRTDKRQARNP